MKNEEKRSMIIQFKDAILRQRGVLEEKIDWYFLSLGFFLGLGINDKDAITLANRVKREKKSWTEEELNESAPEKND